MASTNSISQAAIQARSQLDALSYLIKLGVEPNEALCRVGIKNLERTIIPSGLCDEEIEEEASQDDVDVETEANTNMVELECGADEGTVGGVDESSTTVNTAQNTVAEHDETKLDGVKMEMVQSEDAKEEQVKSDDAKIDETKSEKGEIEQPKSEGAKQDDEVESKDDKQEEGKIEEVKGGEVKAENAEMEVVKSEESETEQSESEDAKMEEIKFEDDKMEETKNEESDTDKPKSEEAKIEKVELQENGTEQGEIISAAMESDKIETKDQEEDDDICAGLESGWNLVDEKTKALRELDIVMEDDRPENILGELIDWLLVEADYCAHCLLLKSGNVMVDSEDKADKTSLWVPPDHQSLANDGVSPTESAIRRLKNSISAIQLLLNYQSIRSRFPCEDRYGRIVTMVVASGHEYQNEIPSFPDSENTTPAVSAGNAKSFFTVVSTDPASQELYLLKNGLPGYVDAIQGLLEKLTGLHWNLNIMNAMHEASDMIRDYEQVHVIVRNLGDAKKITDIRVAGNYFALFKKVFRNLSFTDKKRIMKAFFDLHGAPMWQTMDSEFDGILSSDLNKISAQIRQREDFQKLVEDFAWLFILNLKQTWWRLLQTIMRIPAVTAIVIKLLRELEPVTAVRIADKGHRVVLLGVRRLLEEKKIWTEHQERNWISLIYAMTHGTPSSIDCQTGKRKSSPDQPLFDKTEVMKTTVLPLLVSYPYMGLNCVLALIGPGNKRCGIRWTENPGENGICAAKVFSAIVDVFINAKKEEESSNVDGKLAKVSLDTLAILMEIWKFEKIQFPDEELQKWRGRLDTTPWAARYLVSAYLRYVSKESVRLPVPACVLEIFKLPSDLYRCVDCDNWTENHSKLQCVLVGLFQLAGLSIRMAVDIVNTADFGSMVDAMKECKLNEPLVVAIEQALIDAKSLHVWRNAVDLYTLIFDRLKENSGMGFEESMCLKSYSAGLRAGAPAGKFCEAISRIITKKPHLSQQYVRNFSVVAHDSIVERIVNLEDPLSRISAWEYLFTNACALTTAFGYESSEMEMLLMAIVNKVEKENVLYHKHVFKVVAGCLRDEFKGTIAKKLKLETVEGEELVC